MNAYTSDTKLRASHAILYLRDGRQGLYKRKDTTHSVYHTAWADRFVWLDIQGVEEFVRNSEVAGWVRV